MKKTVRLAVAGVALAALTALGAGMAANAHHAFAAEFDAEAPVLLKGKVTVIEWTNPHTWIHIGEVKQTLGTGKETTTVNQWAVEGGTPNTLFRTGIDESSLKKGTEIVVRGYQSKDALCEVHRKTKKKTCKANGRDVTFPNGCKLFVGSSGTGAPSEGEQNADDSKRAECQNMGKT